MNFFTAKGFVENNHFHNYLIPFSKALHVPKRISLKISKYNKHLQNKLNIGIKDFQNFSDLKEMNVIYHTNIKDTDIKCLKLINKKINDDKL